MARPGCVCAGAGVGRTRAARMGRVDRRLGATGRRQRARRTQRQHPEPGLAGGPQRAWVRSRPAKTRAAGTVWAARAVV